MALRVTWGRCFPVCALLFGACAIPAEAASPEDARRSYDAGHFADAMGIWAELSRDGNAEAAFGIGLMYNVGNGTEENPQTAFFWYMKAAEAGLPAAEFNVAAMYDGGRGVAQSVADAALWYAKAAAHGHLRAEYKTLVCCISKETECRATRMPRRSGSRRQPTEDCGKRAFGSRPCKPRRR